jgi:hypothetical protein
MKSNCNWREALLSHLGMKINVPNTNCVNYIYKGKPNVRIDGIAHNPMDKNTPLDFPCMDRSMIMHHSMAASILTEDPKVNTIIRSLQSF